MVNLQSENARLGRETGNRMIKDFVEILTSVFAPSAKLFVGNNGAGQYLVFAEGQNKELVKAALFQTHVLLEQKSKGCKASFQSGVTYLPSGEERDICLPEEREG